MKPLILLVLLLQGCSVAKVLSQDSPADIKGIGIGTPRLEVIQRIGTPTVSEEINGKKQDMFTFNSGYHNATKIRALFYLAGDVFTLGLSEIIFYPLEETVLDEAKCTATATYDNNMKVDFWKVTNIKSISTQDC